MRMSMFEVFPEQCDQRDGHDMLFRTKIHEVHRRPY